jgi:hypothetical protein
MSNYQLQLKKFDISKISSHKIVFSLGNRKTGKSFLTRDLLYHHRKNLSDGILICPTDGDSYFYADFIPKIFIHIHDKNDTNIIKYFLKTQEVKIDYIENNDRNAFIVLDDIFYRYDWNSDEHIKEIFSKVKYLNIMCIFNIGLFYNTITNIKNDVDYIFIFRYYDRNNKKQIFEEFIDIFKDYEIYSSIIDQYTDNYGCLVIDNKCKSDKIEDKVYWYKAEYRENFSICSSYL